MTNCKETIVKLKLATSGPRAQALRRVMGKFLTFRAKKIAGDYKGKKKTVMQVYVDAKDWPFSKMIMYTEKALE